MNSMIVLLILSMSATITMTMLFISANSQKNLYRGGLKDREDKLAEKQKLIDDYEEAQRKLAETAMSGLERVLSIAGSIFGSEESENDESTHPFNFLQAGKNLLKTLSSDDLLDFMAKTQKELDENTNDGRNEVRKNIISEIKDILNERGK